MIIFKQACSCYGIFLLKTRKLNLKNVSILCEFTKSSLMDLDGQEQHLKSLDTFIQELSEEMEEIESDFDEQDEKIFIEHGLEMVKNQVKSKRSTKVSKQADALFLDDQKPSWHRLVARISHFYSKLYRTIFLNYRRFVLHELVYFEDENEIVKRAIAAEPRSNLNNALVTPGSYLNCSECTTVMSAHSQDISILYNLYLECSKMINLKDFYEAFKSVLAVEQDGEMVQ